MRGFIDIIGGKERYPYFFAVVRGVNELNIEDLTDEVIDVEVDATIEYVRDWFENELKDPDERGPICDGVKEMHAKGLEAARDLVRANLERGKMSHESHPELTYFVRELQRRDSLRQEALHKCLKVYP
jgi:hypothetical protein